jgi:hypothetical protein
MHVKKNGKQRHMNNVITKNKEQNIQKEIENGLNYVHLVHVLEECLKCERMPSFPNFALASLINIH